MRNSFMILCALLVGALSCARGAMDPVTPESSPPLTIPSASAQAANRCLFGIWVFDVSADRSSVDVRPIRAAEWHFNIRTFLENGPCTDCLSLVGLHPQGNGILDVDIRIKHPFVGMDRFTGFDVRGTIMFPSTSTWDSSGLTWSRELDGGAELLNPDGWTTLFNPIDFEQKPGDPNIFTYQQGKLATPVPDAATLNPFIAFYKDPNRRPFFSYDQVIRTYSIKLPDGPLQFGYAVDASWFKPDPDPPIDVPDDFPITANCIEAYRISAHVGEGMTPDGGDATCEIEIYDWQGTDTISTVTIECPDLFTGILPASLDMDFGTISFWSVQVDNDTLADEGDYPLLIRVDDTEGDKFLGALAAYQVIPARVGPQSQFPPGVYVDRDYPGNAGGLPELGTPEAPFTTINKGVIAAEYDDTIYIDPSLEPYNEQVYLMSGRYLLGSNWREDGDSGQPVVEAMEYESSIYATGVDDVTIDNLEVRPGGDLWEEFLWGIRLHYTDPTEHHQNVTVKNCTFTGDRVHTGNNYGDEIICCEVDLTDNFVFEDNVITEVHAGSDQGGYLGGLHCDVCYGVTVRGNRMYDCTSKNSFLGMHIWYSQGAVLVENNDFGPLTNSDEPTGFTIGWGINVISYSDVTVRQNVVHDFGEPGHRLETVGLFFRSVGQGIETDWIIENNLIYNMYAQDADNTYNSADCRGIMFRMNTSNDLDGLVIANNTLIGLTSGEYVNALCFDIGSGNTLYNYRIENNIIADVKGPATPDTWETSAAVYCYWPGHDLVIDYTLFYDVVIPDPMFYGAVDGIGNIYDLDPMFLPDYHFPTDSPAQLGDPSFIDFDDAGPPSGDPDNPDPETRSRMGAYGGPGGNW